jgi:hypothetical protein
MGWVAYAAAQCELAWSHAHAAVWRDMRIGRVSAERQPAP